MIRNYFKIAWRNLKRNKRYSAINILGLTVGLTACMLIATVVLDDLTYDTNWSKKDELYRILSVQKSLSGEHSKFASAFMGLKSELVSNFPEVQEISAITPTTLSLKLSENGEGTKELNILSADTTIWKLLDFKVLAGNPKKYTHGQNNLVITRSFKDQYFPKEKVLGKILYDIPSYQAEAKPYLITGIIEDIPSNTHLRAQAIWVNKGRTEALNTNGSGTFSNLYMEVRPQTDIAQLTKKVNGWYSDFIKQEDHFSFEFQPITDVYLHSDFQEYQEVKGDYKTIFILSGIAILLLVIACLNYINLSSARALHRLQEVGVRKILGAGKKRLISQFLTESLLFFGIATVLALAIYQIALAQLTLFLGHEVSHVFTTDLSLLASLLSSVVLISLLTGVYPALLMSGFNPISALKGQLYKGTPHNQKLIRKSLVVFQFTISIVVLIALIVVQQQVTFLKTRDLGFKSENLLSIGSVSWDGKGTALKSELLKIPGVTDASFTSWIPSLGKGYMTKRIEDPQNPDRKIEVAFIKGDASLAQTLGLSLQSGRLLNESFTTDSAPGEDGISFESEERLKTQASLITAYTAQLLNIKELNKIMPKVGTTPVGIVENFNNESLRNPILPTVIIAESQPYYGGMLVRINLDTDKQVVAQLQKTWRSFYPVKKLDVNWVSDLLQKQYNKEIKLQQFFNFFSMLSMFLAALGILGLIAQAASQRVKEIGIRKTLGASVIQLMNLLISDFLKLVLIAILISSPIAWYAMKSWLQDFAYRITIGWDVFAIAGSIALLVALLTVSYQGIKAATSNPVKSLRTE